MYDSFLLVIPVRPRSPVGLAPRPGDTPPFSLASLLPGMTRCPRLTLWGPGLGPKTGPFFKDPSFFPGVCVQETTVWGPGSRARGFPVSQQTDQELHAPTHTCAHTECTHLQMNPEACSRSPARTLTTLARSLHTPQTASLPPTDPPSLRPAAAGSISELPCPSHCQRKTWTREDARLVSTPPTLPSGPSGAEA